MNQLDRETAIPGYNKLMMMMMTVMMMEHKCGEPME
jgi:hypothetical protein